MELEQLLILVNKTIKKDDERYKEKGKNSKLNLNTKSELVFSRLYSQENKTEDHNTRYQTHYLFSPETA